MTDTSYNEFINEARQFYLAGPVVLPLLEKRKRIAFDLLMAKHKEGKTDTVALVAELSVLNDLERDIKQKQAQYEAMEAKHVSRR